MCRVSLDKNKNSNTTLFQSHYLSVEETEIQKKNKMDQNISHLGLSDCNEKKIIRFYAGEYILPKYLITDQALVLRCGFIVIYLEDENGKKKIIDFKIPGENLHTKFKISKEKLHQIQVKALEYTEIFTSNNSTLTDCS